MKFYSLILIIVMTAISLEVRAGRYPEPGGYTITKAKDYYANSFGYDTTKDCTGASCIPAGSQVMCSKYSYIAGPQPNTRVQFCHIKSIAPNSGRPTDVTSRNLSMATGYISENGDYIHGVPSNQRFGAATAAAACDGNCGEVGKNKITELVEAVESIVGALPPQETSDIQTRVGNAMTAKLTRRRGAFNSRCANFIGRDGRLGPLGTSAINAMKKINWKCFDSGIDVTSVCPNFGNFDLKTKEYFWVWAFASIAQEESSCNPVSRNPNGTNDIADGLMQMEYSGRQRRRAGRNRNYCPHTAVDSQNITFQFECSASIFVDTTCKRGWPLASTKGYWAELRGSSNQISKHIKDFPGCN